MPTDSAMSSIRILVIEDDEDTRINLRDILELDDHSVDLAATAAEATNRDNWSDYAAIILDRKLPDGTAIELLPMLKERAPEASIVIVTGYADLQGAIAALRLGAADYILKPLNPDALRASLGRVAERRRLALAKERSESAFRNLVDAAEVMILILRPDRTIAYFSPYAERLTGYQSNEVLGKDFFSLFLIDQERPSVFEEFQRVLDGHPTPGYPNRIVCRDGTPRWIVWNSRLLPDHGGGPAILAVGQDITILKQTQERALQSERLAAIGQMVAGLAHESRNALQRSQACLEMLALHVQDRPEALDLIARLQNAQDHLHHLYEDVRSYAAPIRLDRQRVDLGNVLREAWIHLEPQRKGRDVTLHEQVEVRDLHCEADPFRLEQVFRNILENALSACPDPTQIEIKATPAQFEGKDAIRLSLCDNGPGFTPEQRRNVFEPFFTTKTKGTGLGLAITRRIVEAHGGRISLGQGTRPGAEMIIILPREQP